MVYRRRKIFKKKRYSRRTTWKRWAKKVYRAVNSRAEKKIFGTTATGVALNNTGALIPLNNIGIGSAKFARIGNKVKERYLKVKITASQNGATLVSDVVRISIVRGRTQGLVLADTPTSTSTQSWDIDKWHILRDKRRTMGSGGTDGKDYVLFDFTVRLGGREVIFNDGNINPVTRPLYLFYWSTSAATDPTITYDILYTYTDI